ncbi:MAG: PIN domain-containing protein [Leptospiraceae bacterium]|nr:PIN domain-containing protein [Leptospiraceae bacterium]
MLNLDTHILIFLLEGELKPRETRLIKKNDLAISDIVLWELTKLHQLGRIQLDFNGPEFKSLMALLKVFPIDQLVCKCLLALDFKSDPADEIIAATSLAHNVPLLTRDNKIRKSRIVPLA